MQYPKSYMNKTVAALIVPLLCVAVWCTGASAQEYSESDVSARQQQSNAIRLGIVIDSDDAQMSTYAKALTDEIKSVLGQDMVVTLEDSNILTGDGTNEQALENLNTLLASDQVDVVVTFGVLGAAQAVRMTTVSKPLVAPFILDPKIQRAPLTKKGTSGRSNLNYLLNAPSFRESMQIFKDAVHPTTVAVITDNLVGDLSLSEQEALLKAQVKDLGISLTVLPYEGDVTLDKLPAEVDGVFVFPLVLLPKADKQKLYAGLTERKLLSFAWRGVPDVELGALLSYTERVDLGRLNRRIAISISKLQENINFSDLEVGFVENGKHSINLSTAKQLSFEPGRSLMANAIVIGEDGQAQRNMLTIQSAVKEALKKNLSYLSTQAEVAAGKTDYATAWTRYFPQLYIAGAYTAMDADTARLISEQYAQQTLMGQMGFTQNILDHRAITNISIQRSLNDQRDASLEQAKLDISLTVASAYLNVQMAKANLEIYGENLKVTEYNLSMAKRRHSIGLAGPAEVYRWESEQASDLQRVIAGQTQLKSAMYALNQLLHRDLLEQYEMDENDFLVNKEFKQNERWQSIFDKPTLFSQFKEFISQKGLASSPELKQLDALIDAKEKERRDSVRGYYLPKLAMQGTLENRLWDKPAEGAADPVLPENHATIGASLSWNIFEGGAKIAAHKKARKQTAQLEFDREDTRTRLKQIIFTNISNIVASAASVELSSVASESAHKNLDIATEAYSLGTIPLERLVDAQRQAFNADQMLANSRFRLKLDELNLMRAINQLHKYLQHENPGLSLLEEFEKTLK